MKSLTALEIAKAQENINRMQAGIYELSDIYGTQWKDVASPTSFGAAFKAAAVAGSLRRIEVLKPKSNNHHVYKIED